MRRLRTAAGVSALLGSVLVVAGCGATRTIDIPHSQPEQAPSLMEAYGCGACHTIPGVAGADANVGPSLANLDERRTIAGVLPNTPDNLLRWLRDPQSVSPGTVMPNLGLGEPQARDIAAYLYRH